MRTETEIDLLYLLKCLWNKAWIIVLSMLVMGAVLVSYAVFFAVPQYQATAMLYVDNGSSGNPGENRSISSGELTAAKGLLETYIVILQTRTTMEQVIAEAGVDYSYEQLSSMVSASSVDSTEIFSITVTGKDPTEVELIVKTFVKVLPGRIAEVVEGSSVRLVDDGVLPTKRSSSSYTQYAFIGVLIGAIISCTVIIVPEMMDTTVKNEEDLNRWEIPILAVVPHIGKRQQNSFAVTEAYKRIRTKVLLSLPDACACCTIGVSGAMEHEGKSAVSIRLANDLAQMGKEVLLLDADMRFFRCAKTPEHRQAPGLSDFLTGDAEIQNIIQHAVAENYPDVIFGGKLPQNPTELLASERMQVLFGELKKAYRYIVIHCPPLSVVPDALIVSRYTDGMIMVVKQKYTEKQLLDTAINELRSSDANIIGMVMTDVL